VQLHDGKGQRLYMTESERTAFLEAASKAPREVRTLCMMLAYTGCRVSEALALTNKGVDMGNKAIVFETLKKRKSGIYRAVPAPEILLDTLSMAHGLNEPVRGKKRTLPKPLWDWTRKTAWQKITHVMKEAGIGEGPHRCPKGLRHGYGVLAISKGVPLNMLSKWMGHASLEVTAIYANALGEEQRNIAARMWS
jgi:integrase/recombinase XerD